MELSTIDVVYDAWRSGGAQLSHSSWRHSAAFWASESHQATEAEYISDRLPVGGRCVTPVH